MWLSHPLQLAISGTSPIELVLPAMVGVHLLIGIGEALITVATIAFVRQTRPDLLNQTITTRAKGFGWVAVGFSVALLTVPFITSEIITTIVAGIIGVIVVSAIGLGIGQITQRKRPLPQLPTDSSCRGAIMVVSK